jgi:hypothetical protein
VVRPPLGGIITFPPGSPPFHVLFCAIMCLQVKVILRYLVMTAIKNARLFVELGSRFAQYHHIIGGKMITNRHRAVTAIKLVVFSGLLGVVLAVSACGQGKTEIVNGNFVTPYSAGSPRLGRDAIPTLNSTRPTSISAVSTTTASASSTAYTFYGVSGNTAFLAGCVSCNGLIMDCVLVGTGTYQSLVPLE